MISSHPVLFGNLLLGIYTAFLGYIGAKTGLSTHLLALLAGVKAHGFLLAAWRRTGRLVWRWRSDVRYSVSKATRALMQYLVPFGSTDDPDHFRHLGVDHFVYHCRTRDRYSGRYSRLAGGQRRGWAGAFKTIVPQTPLDFSRARWHSSGLVCQRRYRRRLRPLRASCQAPY